MHRRRRSFRDRILLSVQNTYNEAIQSHDSDQWKIAMDLEMESM